MNKALEVQVNSLQAEERYRDNQQMRGEIWDNDKVNEMSQEVEHLRRRLREYEDGTIPGGPESQKMLMEFAERVKDLEMENEMLRKGNLASNVRSSRGQDLEVRRENDELRREIEILRNEVETKENIIRTLGSQNGGDAMNMEAIENLKKANDRLIQKMIDMQKNLDSSVYNSGINNSLARSGFEGGGRFSNQPGASVLKDTNYSNLDII
jgi:hypothetical protein